MLSNLYPYIVFNYLVLPVTTTDSLLLDLELSYLASFLKYKFNDKRTIVQLVELIKDEYKLV